jgi:hypothetical protein
MEIILVFLKGSLTRDFRLQVFFMNQCPPGPQVFHWSLFELMFVTGVNDTGDKLFSGVNDTGKKFIAGVDDTGEQFIFPRCR